MKVILIVLSFVICSNCLAQGKLNLRSFIENSSLRSVDESTANAMLDSIRQKFLMVANNSQSKVHVEIQDEFSSAKQTDMLGSYVYPKKLKRTDFNAQLLNCTQINHLYGKDSALSYEFAKAIILIPLMIEEVHGSSIGSICFIAEFEISGVNKLDLKNPEKTISFKITKINMDATAEEKVLYDKKNVIQQ